MTTQWFFDSINKKACQDETKYLLPMTENARNALLHPANLTRLDISRLSPALRRSHLMKLTGVEPVPGLTQPLDRETTSKSHRAPKLIQPTAPHVVCVSYFYYLIVYLLTI